MTILDQFCKRVRADSRKTKITKDEKMLRLLLSNDTVSYKQARRKGIGNARAEVFRLRQIGFMIRRSICRSISYYYIPTK